MLQMDFLKTIGTTVVGKIVGGIVGIAVIAMGIAWWQMPQSTRDGIFSTTGHILHTLFIILGWLILVGVVPWVSFYFIGWVGRLGRNAAGALLVLGYTTAEAVFLAWLFNWSISGATGIVFFSCAILVAAAYNLFACDWIAEKLE
jgi:hypothetical protein